MSPSLKLYNWLTRCTPALTITAVIVLLISALALHPYGTPKEGLHYRQSTWAQLTLALYVALLHTLSALFPIRLVLAIIHVTSQVKLAANIEQSRTERTQNNASVVQKLIFVIILPAYKEDQVTLQDTLEVLASHWRSRNDYHIYLAFEDAEDDATGKALSLIRAFEHRFCAMSYTVHPTGLPGEVPGKSSNESWAAKQVCRDFANTNDRRNIIVTIMDSDSHIPPRYFDEISAAHLHDLDAHQSTIYVTPVTFDRNLHQVPLLVRMADLLWAGAGLSNMYAGSRIVIPTSVYSIPLLLVEFVGGWDTGPDAIGEDMHMYLKCFFACSGNLKSRVVHVAVSQCNVSSELIGIRGYVDTLRARYRQALRHMWGALDIGYAIRQSVNLASTRRQKDTNYSKRPMSGDGIEDLAEQPSTSVGKLLDSQHLLQRQLALQSLDIYGILNTYMKLFEAHFMPSHLVVISGALTFYQLLCPSFLVPTSMRVALIISAWCQMLGFWTMFMYFCLYSKYHRLCAAMRQKEMNKAGLLRKMPQSQEFPEKLSESPIEILSILLFPIAGIIFGVIPAIQATICHLFTDRLQYNVSPKPTFEPVDGPKIERQIIQQVQ